MAGILTRLIPGRIGALALVLLLAMTATSLLSAAPRRYVALFGSKDCDQCAELKELWQQQSWSDQTVVMVYVSVDDDRNYGWFKQIEQKLRVGAPGSTFPVILAGKQFFSGMDEFTEVLPELPQLVKNAPQLPLLAPLQAAADNATSPVVVCNAPAAPQKDAVVSAATTSNALSGLRLLYLSTPGCKKCARQQRELQQLSTMIPALQVDHYDLATPEGQVIRQRVLKHFQLGDTEASFSPAVIWNGGYVEGRTFTAEELLAQISPTMANATEPPSAPGFWSAPITSEEQGADAAAWKSVLDNATWLTMLSAGAVDGVNPCAFATVIFLISYLMYLKRGRRYVLGVGLCFCFGVFASYLALGVGLSMLVKELARFPIIKTVLYGAFGVVALVFAGLHFRDGLKVRRSGRAADMDMGLSTGTHRKIHDRIHKWGNITSWLAFPAAIILGVVISSLELVCTGQIYLPILMAVNASGFNLQAFYWLLLYNVAFIAPLLLVTGLAYYGVGANALAQWAKKNIVKTKFAMAAVFLLIAALMLAFAIG